jgi:hypothetical protein
VNTLGTQLGVGRLTAQFEPRKYLPLVYRNMCKYAKVKVVRFEF